MITLIRKQKLVLVRFTYIDHNDTQTHNIDSDMFKPEILYSKSSTLWMQFLCHLFLNTITKQTEFGYMGGC
jgi:hypothetical protein